MLLQLISQKQLAGGLWEFTFDIHGKKFSFKAGQYVRVVVPKLIKKDTKGPGRVFSIASSPNDKKKISIIFRVSESGYKQTLARTKVGQKLEVEGPWGTLQLPKKTDKPLVFIAGGTGITPFLSMLRFAAGNKLKYNITLLYASRDRKNAIYLEELKKIEKENPRFKMIPKFGLLDRSFIEENVSQPDKTIFYVAGPIPMQDSVILSLEELGVTNKFINFEEWSEHVFKRTPIEVADVMPNAMIVSDLNGFFRYVNHAWEKISGWKKREVIAKFTPRILKSGFHDTAFYKKFWNTALAGKVYKFEAVDKHKNGTLYTIEEASTPFRSPSGCIFGHLVIQRDITKMRKVENDLKDLTEDLNRKVKEQVKFITREKLRNEAILQNIGEGLGVVDENMKTVIINRSAQEILGFTQKEAIGKVWPLLVRVGTDEIREMPAIDSPLGRAIKGRTTATTFGSVNYYYKKKNGERIPVLITATPLILNRKIVGAIVLFRDITKEKEIERSKDEFLALASHQLRTPLTGIRWAAELLSKKEQLTERGKKYIDEINFAAKRLADLVDSLLNVSRIEMGRVAILANKFDAVALVKDVIKEHEVVIAKKNIQIIFEKHPPVLEIILDYTILYNILDTLVPNAIDYTLSGGKVEISLEKKEKTFVMAVRDTGMGIAKEDQPNIFKKFFRSAKARLMQPSGNGLGLYLVSQMAKLLGAKIWFESQEGEGTTFYVELPLEVKSRPGDVQLIERKIQING